MWRSARLIPFSSQRWLQCLLRWDCKGLGKCNPTQKGCRSPPGKCSPCKRNTAFKSFDSFPVFGISLLISKCDLTSTIKRVQHPHVTDGRTEGDKEFNRVLGLATNQKKRIPRLKPGDTRCYVLDSMDHDMNFGAEP